MKDISSVWIEKICGERLVVVDGELTFEDMKLDFKGMYGIDFNFESIESSRFYPQKPHHDFVLSFNYDIDDIDKIYYKELDMREIATDKWGFSIVKGRYVGIIVFEFKKTPPIHLFCKYGSRGVRAGCLGLERNNEITKDILSLLEIELRIERRKISHKEELNEEKPTNLFSKLDLRSLNARCLENEKKIEILKEKLELLESELRIERRKQKRDSRNIIGSFNM